MTSSLKILTLLLLPLFSIGQINNQKIKGISFYPPVREQLTTEMVASVKQCHVDWIAFVPEVLLERETLTFRSEEKINHLGKSVAGVTEGMAIAKSIGLKVMLKPHMEISDPLPVVVKSSMLDWFSFGEKEKVFSEKDKTMGATWRGDFYAANGADWKTWEHCYETYILNWARIADSLSVDLFSIGTELKESAKQRPQFWRQLILKVREIYNGPITYSANWDEYQQVSFWPQLDYIGVDAYFPISLSKTPSVKELLENWKPISLDLKSISEKYQRKVLITEVGYRNVSYAGLEPWTHDHENAVQNDQAQVNLYEGYFRTFQQESYIAGSFLWQWIYKDLKKGNTDFTPQGKPAMEVISRYWGE
ncbi:MAG: hypothetical protein AB8F74_11495 [Saprospiraceae bacterium]